MRRAQSGVEFLAVFAVAIVLFLVVQTYYLDQRNDVVGEAGRASAEKLAAETALLINLASRQAGFYAEFTVPAALVDGNAFTMRASNYSVSVDWGGRSVVKQVQAASVRNQSGGAILTLDAGTYSVNNTGGGVLIAKK